MPPTRSWWPVSKPARPKGKGSVSQKMVVDGVQVSFTPKKVKNINMRVSKPDGQVAVSAPTWMDVASVESFIREKMPWIRRRQKAIAEAPSACGHKASPEELADWREKVSAATEELVSYWEPVMGVRAGVLAYRNMTSRWGSCNPKTGRVCINIQLANYPPVCLEYVVVHELCHLIERKHGPRFKELMTKYLPDWRQRRALLR